MKEKRVEEIVLPFPKGTPLHPSVCMEDRITHAIELMVTHNLRRIVVVLRGRPVGMIRLEDALRELGLQTE